MQIFVLDVDPNLAARFACDRHVVKICTEAGQILTTALHNKVVDQQGCCLPEGHWKPTHKAHPLCKWAENQTHAEWVLEYGLALCREYTTRYGGKIHKTEAYLRKLDLSFLPVGSWEGFLQVIPEEFKDPTNPVKAYRNYYLGPRISAFATWKNRNPPEWWIDRRLIAGS